MRVKEDLFGKLFSDYSQNPEALLCLHLLFETDKTAFLTGKAGSGKTTLVKRITEVVPNTIVVAPTGIAASNAGGSTIHKTFGLPIGILEPQKEYRISDAKISVLAKADLFVMDEVSMLRADVLLAIDTCLRNNLYSDKPFGGKRVLLVGDLFQLPPVLTNKDTEYFKSIFKSVFFFDCGISDLELSTVELSKVYRQSDNIFVDILNNIRKGEHTSDCIATLNTRLDRFFEQKIDTPHINLVSTNQLADSVNERMFNLCKGKTKKYNAEITGNFDATKVNAETELRLKLGLRIVFIVNDKAGRFFNGSQGTVVSLEDNTVTVEINGIQFAVERNTWENVEYIGRGKDIERVVRGTFSQFPIKLGYAITIHKSQGLYF